MLEPATAPIDGAQSGGQREIPEPESDMNQMNQEQTS